MRWRNVILGAGLAGLLAAGRLQATGPVPEGFDPPEGTRVLAGVDVQAFLASPLYARLEREGKGLSADLQRLRDETGLDLERDVDQVVFAGSGPGGGVGHLLVHVSGRFDSYALGRSIEKKGRATWRSVAGNTLYLLNEGQGSGGALTILGDHALVLGSPADVEALLEGRGGRRSPLLEVAADVPSPAAFWLAADGQLARSMSPGAASPSPGQPAGPTGFALPPLRSILVTGDLEPQLRVEARAEALDEAAARNLADAVRGLVALASLQAAQKPELLKLVAGVQVESQGTRATLRLALPWELLDELDKKPAPKPAVTEQRQ